MDKINFELIIFLFVVTCLREGLSINCYECNSARDPNCADPFNNQTIESVDCDSYRPGKNATFCRKNVQKVSLEGRTDFRVVRACGWAPDKKESLADVKADDLKEADADGASCFTRAGTFEVMVTYCKCMNSLCNGVEKLMPSYMTAMSLTALASSTLLFTSTRLLL